MGHQIVFKNSDDSFGLGNPGIRVSFFLGKNDCIEDLKFLGIITESNEVVAKEFCNYMQGVSIYEVNFEDLDSKFLPYAHFLSVTIEHFLAGNHDPVTFKEQLDPTQIICRCNGITVNEVNKLVEENYGDLARVLKSSMMAQVCGNCLGDLKGFCESAEGYKDQYLGKNLLLWKELIKEELSSMNSSLPVEYRGLYFELINFNEGLLKLRCSGDRDGLGRKDIAQTIRHHLQGKLQIPIETSIVF